MGVGEMAPIRSIMVLPGYLETISDILPKIALQCPLHDYITWLNYIGNNPFYHCVHSLLVGTCIVS